jgi:hypothetical protein
VLQGGAVHVSGGGRGHKLDGPGKRVRTGCPSEGGWETVARDAVRMRLETFQEADSFLEGRPRRKGVPWRGHTADRVRGNSPGAASAMALVFILAYPQLGSRRGNVDTLEEWRRAQRIVAWQRWRRRSERLNTDLSRF